jgi:hypothetical protein
MELISCIELVKRLSRDWHICEPCVCTHFVSVKADGEEFELYITEHSGGACGVRLLRMVRGEQCG